MNIQFALFYQPRQSIIEVMSDDFDPYLRWLGIRDPDRPPNHYRLLGVAEFEDDADVLANAADRQMAHIRTFQAGPHSADSQRLLNELAAAKICLLNAEKKAAYDAQLQRRRAAAPPAPPPAPMLKSPPVERPSPPSSIYLETPVVVTEPPRTKLYSSSRRKSSALPFILTLLGVVILLMIGVAFFYFRFSI